MIRVGTRASALARTQAQLVADAVTEATGEETVLVTVTTAGDRSTAPLQQLAQRTGGVGVFVSALRDALLAGEVDVAVHSLKDLPTAPPVGIALAAVPQREDPRDVLVTRPGLLAGGPGDGVGAAGAVGTADPRGLGGLPDGTRVGTGSPRRAAMLRAAAARHGRRVEVVDVRGNVDTRLARVQDDLDAVVLALAGLRRLGMGPTDRHDLVVLEPEVMLPAPGQGALAVECRAGDPLAQRLADALDHPPTRAATTAERTLLAVLDTGCSAPVGALARVAGDDLVLHGAASGEGDRAGEVVRVRVTGSVGSAGEVGERGGVQLLAARRGRSTTPRDTEHQPQHEESLR